MPECVSNIHNPAVPATVHGSFKSPWNALNNHDDTWYCDRCAETGVLLRVFTPDPRDQGYCWPTLGEPCGQCHRCTDPADKESRRG